MVPLLVDIGAVGSIVDVATLVVSLSVLWRLREQQTAGHAATVAVAEKVDGVDDDHIRADLEVDQRDSRQYLATDGGRR